MSKGPLALSSLPHPLACVPSTDPLLLAGHPRFDVNVCIWVLHMAVSHARVVIRVARRHAAAAARESRSRSRPKAADSSVAAAVAKRGASGWMHSLALLMCACLRARLLLRKDDARAALKMSDAAMTSKRRGGQAAENSERGQQECTITLSAGNTRLTRLPHVAFAGSLGWFAHLSLERMGAEAAEAAEQRWPPRAMHTPPRFSASASAPLTHLPHKHRLNRRESKKVRRVQRQQDWGGQSHKQRNKTEAVHSVAWLPHSAAKSTRRIAKLECFE